MNIAEAIENRNAPLRPQGKAPSWEASKASALAHPQRSVAAATGIAFMTRIDPIGWWNLVAIDPQQKSPLVGKTFPPNSWDLIALFIDRWNGERNLYLTVNEPLPHSRDDKLSEDEIANIRALYVDVDPEKGVPFETAREALDDEALRVQSAPLPPMVLVDTGGGNQMFWVLAEKVDAKGDGKDRARLQGRALKKVYGADTEHFHGDKVHSIEHLMRLPGTVNLPTVSKLKDGRVARPAKILFQNDRRYTLGHFEKHLAQPGPEVASSVDTDPLVRAAIEEIDLESARSVVALDDLSDELQKRFKLALRDVPELAGVWAADPKFRLADDPTRSGWRASLAIALARYVPEVFSVQEYVELVHSWPVVDNSHDLDARQYARDWGKFAAGKMQERKAVIEQFFHEHQEQPTSDWAEPLDIFGDEDPMDLGNLPDNALPPIIDQFARSEARRKGVSLAFAASAAIGVTAAAIGASLRIQVKQWDTGWTEFASLWLALVADPGRVKTPTIGAATRPLQEIDSEFYRKFKARHDIWTAQAQAHKRRKDAPSPGDEPIMRRITVDDVTFEKQARIHADNPRGILRTPDELMGFFGSFGAYKASGDGDRTQMLRLFDGGSIMLDRVGAGSIRAEQALMGIVAGTQPEKIAKAVRDLGADGMLQRFLFVLDDGKARKSVDEAPNERAAAGYRALLRELATGEYTNAPVVRMDEAAQKLFNDIAENIDGLKGVVGMPLAWQGHIQKWGKFLPRLVLTFHCIDMFALYGCVDPKSAVDTMSVERTGNFARFLLRHSMTFYRQYFDLGQDAEESQWFAGYLLTHPEVSIVDHRTLYDARKSLRGDANRRLRVRILKDLESVGWLRTAEQGTDGPARCSVNPTIHARFAARAEWERRDREAKRAAIEKSAQAKNWLTDETSGK